jgi:hypothetical protein
MAQDQSVESQTIAVTSTSGGLAANFQGGIQQAYISSTVDCYVSFDDTATNSDLLIKANLQPVRISFGGANVQNIYALATGSSGTVYILGVRGRG